MWNQAARGQERGELEVGEKDKQQVDSQVDSGFLSGSNLLSSELSIDLENEEHQAEEPVVAPEPKKAIESGLDLGLLDSLNQLSLKESILNPLDSGTISPDTNEITSDEIECEKSQKELEPWEIYYAQDDNGDTQLHASIIEGFLEAALFLISIVPHACLLNILNDECLSALHLAVLIHQPRLVRRLIVAGADLTIRNLKGNTPLHIACNTGDLNCVKALTAPITEAERTWIPLGKQMPVIPQNLEQKNYDGETCLHVAASKGYIEIIRQLVRSGANLDAREGLAGRTPLHLAIELRNRELINFLLYECRPKLDMRNYAGATAYHLAYEDKKLARELLKLGATPSMPPHLFSDSESDSEEDDDGGVDNEAYEAPLSRLGISAQSSSPVATA